MLRFSANSAVCAVFLIFFCIGADVADAQVCPGATWQRVEPEAAGWSTRRLKQADALAEELDSDGYLIVDKGRVVWEYGDVALPTNVHSVRKSIVSVLFGVARDRGAVRLDRTIGELGIDDEDGLSPTEKRATVRDLLMARSCIYHPASYETKTMREQRPRRHSCRPGERWAYNNWDFNALATVYAALTRRTVFEGLDDDLARPLQFEHFDKQRDTYFHNERASRHPAYIMRLSALDLARIGLLMSRGGNWCGRQIVSRGWVAESTSALSETDRSTGYGYMWWVGENGRQFRVRFNGPAFSARGSRGQFMIVNPSTDLVIVHRVNTDDRDRRVGGRDFGELLGAIMDSRTAR